MNRNAQRRATQQWQRTGKDRTEGLAKSLYNALSSPLSTRLSSLLDEKDYLAIVSCQVNPLNYEDPDLFRDDYLACELMSKFPSWDIGVDRKQVALDKFREAELQCEEANQRLLWSAPGDNGYPLHSRLESYLFTARGKIRSLLRSFSWDHAEHYFGHGPGGTFATRKSQGDLYYKFGDKKPTVTKGALALAYTAVARVPTWFSHVSGFSGRPSAAAVREIAAYADDLFTVVDGNKVITVPKNAKTDRTIAKEPLMNLYLQRGIGGLIRKRLKYVGVNLDDQTGNQRLAREGSIDGSLATIDLSMASDSLSLELCRLLLPLDWMDALEQCRSPRGVLPSGEVITYQKVSSMGNGFTFELESLIFWALCSAVIECHDESDVRLGVYGDDLVVPVGVFHEVERLLKFSGFLLNEKKSFSVGPFRESCGKHYFYGSDVTPFYVRKNLDTSEQLCLFANNLRRHARYRYAVWGLDGRLEKPYRLAVAGMNSCFRKPSLPSSFVRSGWEYRHSDCALFGDWDECRPSVWPKGYEGWVGRGIVFKARTRSFSDLPFLTRGLAILGGGEEVANQVTTLGGMCKEVKILCTQWPTHGPWL